MSYTIITTCERLVIKHFDDLVLTVLMDLVGLRSQVTCDRSQHKQLLHTTELYV
jgi:hypothetical protein